MGNLLKNAGMEVEPRAFGNTFDVAFRGTGKKC
jgi:hypothetical protein